MLRADKDETEIPLPNVKSKVLEKVIEYMKHHVNNPADEIEKPLKSASMTEVVSQWDADFIDVEQEMLFELILVCTFFFVFVLAFVYTMMLSICHFGTCSFLLFLFPVLLFRLPTTWISRLCWTWHVLRLPA